MNLIKTGKLVLRFVRCNSPIILSAAAGIGLVALYVLTIKETEEAVQEIEEAPEEEVHSFKMAKKVVKIMTPSFVVLVLTMFCVVQSCRISQHRIRDLTQYSAMLAATFNQYRQKNRETNGYNGFDNGTDNDKFIMSQIASDQNEGKKLPELEEGILCQMIGYPNYFTVPNVAFIYTAILKANKYMEVGHGSVELSQWFKWAHAVEYDEKGHVRGMNMNYLHFGWDTYDLQADRNVNVGALYPCIEVVGDDSGLEIYLIDLPAPKPLDVKWNYGI